MESQRKVSKRLVNSAFGLSDKPNINSELVTNNLPQTISSQKLFGSSANYFNQKIVSGIFSILDITSLIRSLCVNKEWRTMAQFFIAFPAFFTAISNQLRLNKLTSLIFNNIAYTYEELDQKSNQLSHYLIELSKKRQLAKESKVCVALDPSDLPIICILAIFKAGMVYVPLNTDADIAAEKLIQIIHSSNPDILLSTSSLKSHPLFSIIESFHTTVIFLDNEKTAIEQYPLQNPEIVISPNDAAYLLFTSGSTGVSKGVLIEHEGLYNRFLSHKRLLQITSKDKVSLFAALGFDASIMEMMMALGSGATLYVVPKNIRLSINELGEFYRKHGITIAIFTPSMLRILDPKDFTEMRVIISTGEAIDKETFARWYWIDEAKTIPRLFINGYGPVEATICTTLGVCTPESGLHIGQPVEGLEVFILEENPVNRTLPKRVLVGERGELYIRGIGIARGYYGQDQKINELNDNRFLTIIHPDDHDKSESDKRKIRVYRSGDAMRWYNGKLEFLERLDRQVKIYGKLVAPEEIDAILKNSPHIEDAYVDIYSNEYGHPIITAYLILKDNHYQPDFADLYQAIAEKLSRTMCPSLWAIISKAQLTQSLNTNGKLDRHKLALNTDIEYHRLQSDPIKLPNDVLENELVALWDQTLRIRDKGFKYSVDDDFRRLGGTSIQAASLIANINLKYPGLKLTPAIFFRNPTISSIVRRIRRQEVNKKIQQHSAEYYFPVVTLTEEKFPIKPHKPNTPVPLFLIHSLLGNPLDDYNYLNEYWKNSRPIYAIQARGIQNPQDMDTTVEEIVTDYVQAIKRIQPDGPYLLAGWSSGGMIAAAMADYLISIGEQVAVLAIDTTHSTLLKNMTLEQFAKHLLSIIEEIIAPSLNIKNLNVVLASLGNLSKIKQINTVINACRNQANAEPEYAERLLTTVQSILLASLRSSVLMSEQCFTLLPTTESQKNFGEKLGWPLNTPAADPIKGNHFSFLKDPNIQQYLAKFIVGFVDKTEHSFFTSMLKNQLKAALKYYYTTHDSRIVRVFGKPLQLRECFINLAIVKKDQQTRAEQDKLKTNSDRSQLYASYEDIFSTTEKEVILPETLFNARDNKIPKHIKIVGRAGIGKSTLSQFICAYLWAIKNCWQEKFQAIIKISARNLTPKRYGKNPQLADIVKIECMDKSGTTSAMSIADIEKTLQAITDEILIVIDGWDEFDQKASPCTDVIMNLLNDPKLSIIILTRPFSDIDNKINSFDLILECIGFTTENIPKYIEKVCATKHQAQAIMAFLRRNRAIHCLAHVPIILDMICTIWDEELQAITNPITMTFLYSKIVAKLLEAYKKKQQDVNPRLTMYEINNKKNTAKEFLALLAFRAMESNSIMLSYDLIKNTVKDYYKCNDEDVSDYLKDLLELGFLNTTDHDRLTGQYYFPHLTVQEYLAACHWINLFTSQKKTGQKMAADFLLQNKYNKRYEVMWWFTAGLIKNVKNQIELQQKYFDLLFTEPKPLMNTHQMNLILKCWDEAELLNISQSAQLIDYLIPFISDDSKQNQWQQFRRTFETCHHLQNHNVIKEVLTKKAIALMKELKTNYWLYIFPCNENEISVIDSLLKCLETHLDKRNLVVYYLSNLNTVNDTIIKKLNSLLSNGDFIIKTYAMRVLTRFGIHDSGSTISMLKLFEANMRTQNTETNVLEAILSSNATSREDTLEFFSTQPSLYIKLKIAKLFVKINFTAPPVIFFLKNLLNHEEKTVRIEASGLLLQINQYPDLIKHTLENLLTDDDEKIRIKTMNILVNLPTDKSTITKIAIKLLCSVNPNICIDALHILENIGITPVIMDTIANDFMANDNPIICHHFSAFLEKAGEIDLLKKYWLTLLASQEKLVIKAVCDAITQSNIVDVEIIHLFFKSLPNLNDLFIVQKLILYLLRVQYKDKKWKENIYQFLLHRFLTENIDYKNYTISLICELNIEQSKWLPLFSQECIRHNQNALTNTPLAILLDLNILQGINCMDIIVEKIINESILCYWFKDVFYYYAANQIESYKLSHKDYLCLQELMQQRLLGVKIVSTTQSVNNSDADYASRISLIASKEELLCKNPPNPGQLHYDLAHLYYQNGNLDKYVFHNELVLITKFPEKYIYSTLAGAYLLQNKLDLAEKYYKIGLNVQCDTAVCNEYGLFLIRQGKWADALEIYKKAIPFNEGNDPSHMMFGSLDRTLLDDHLQRDMGNRTSTIAYLNGTVFSYYYLIKCLIMTNQKDKVGYYLKKFETHIAKDPCDVHFRILSYTYTNLGDKEKASEFAKRGGIDPNNSLQIFV